MKWLIITKNRNDAQLETIRVPLALLRYLNKILPTNCARALTGELVDIDEIIDAGKQRRMFSKNVTVVEKGVHKQILFSL